LVELLSGAVVYRSGALPYRLRLPEERPRTLFWLKKLGKNGRSFRVFFDQIDMKDILKE